MIIKNIINCFLGKIILPKPSGVNNLIYARGELRLIWGDWPDYYSGENAWKRHMCNDLMRKWRKTK